MCAESRSLSSFSQRTTGLCSPVCRLCLGISSLPSVKCQHPECLRDDSGQAGRRNKGKRQSRPQRMGRRGRGWAAEGYFLYFFFVILFVLFLRRMDLCLIENHFLKKENKSSVHIILLTQISPYRVFVSFLYLILLSWAENLSS